MKIRLIYALALYLFSQCAFAALVAGPDSYGYAAYTANYNLRDIQATGVKTPGGDDDLYTVPIGFDFTFQGQTMNSIVVSMNGYLSPTPGSGSSFDIMGYSDDLNSYGGSLSGDTYYQTVGTPGSREFIVGYYGVSHFPCCGTGVQMTFEIILHEGTNNIEYQYAELFDQTNWDNSQYPNLIGVTEARHGSIGLRHFPYNPAGDLSISDAVGYQEYTGYLISSVPVPPAVWLFGSGLIGLVGMARRKK